MAPDCAKLPPREEDWFMPRGVVDLEGLKSPAAETLQAIAHAPPGQDTTLHPK